MELTFDVEHLNFSYVEYLYLSWSQLTNQRWKCLIAEFVFDSTPQSILEMLKSWICPKNLPWNQHSKCRVSEFTCDSASESTLELSSIWICPKNPPWNHYWKCWIAQFPLQASLESTLNLFSSWNCLEFCPGITIEMLSSWICIETCPRINIPCWVAYFDSKSAEESTWSVA